MKNLCISIGHAPLGRIEAYRTIGAVQPFFVAKVSTLVALKAFFCILFFLNRNV